MPHRIQGVWAASVTPLTKDLDIDQTQLARHVSHLLATGNHGVALFGSTGEGNSFTIAERAYAVEHLAKTGLPMDRLLVGAGACAVPDTVALSRVASQAGARGILLHPPFYYKEPSDDGLFAFVEAVIAGCSTAEPSPAPATTSAPEIILYHFPRLVGVGWSETVIARLLEAFPQEIIGIKESSGEFERMARLAETHPGLAVLAGNEKYLLPLLQRTGAGCLTATTNLTAPLARAVFDGYVHACGSPTEATERLQDELTKARTALETAPFIGGIKRLLADAEPGRDHDRNAEPGRNHTRNAEPGRDHNRNAEPGRDADEAWLRVRPPQRPLDAERSAALRAAAAPYAHLWQTNA